MPDRTRTHAVTFRLGDRQYEELVRAVERRGARSVSEFTRTAVLAQIASNHPEQLVERELDTIIAQLEELDAKVRDLRRQLRQATAVSRSAGV
jgi:Arc/MetJ-type ribon-helix-helix transcriptional regulator